MPYEGEVSPQDRPGIPGARLLAEGAALKQLSRRLLLSGAGASGLLAADMLLTRRVQSQRRASRILPVDDDFADVYYPDASWFLFPGYKTSWEESQWILNSLRGALNKRARLAAVGYSNQGLDIDEIVIAVIEYVRAQKLTKLFFYGHSFGGMVATQAAARLLEIHGVEVEFIVLDSSPYSKHDVLDQSWFDGVVFLYEHGSGCRPRSAGATNWGSGSSTKTNGAGARSLTRRWNSSRRSPRPACSSSPSRRTSTTSTAAGSRTR